MSVTPIHADPINFLSRSVLFADVTNLATTAVTTEETLKTYTLPANSLSELDKVITIAFSFTCAPNTNSKTMRVYFGSKVMYSRVTTNSSSIHLGLIYVAHRGVSAQYIHTPCLGFDDTGAIIIVDSSTEDETTAIEIKMTGQNGVATAGDITGQSMIVEALN